MTEASEVNRVLEAHDALRNYLGLYLPDSIDIGGDRYVRLPSSGGQYHWWKDGPERRELVGFIDSPTWHPTSEGADSAMASCILRKARQPFIVSTRQRGSETFNHIEAFLRRHKLAQKSTRTAAL